ncbi:MAG: hypothetical protein JWM98_751 [Thermoleophilia bacterium]|nr:hypothetical protein [Thermoleophilia bacterium]
MQLSPITAATAAAPAPQRFSAATLLPHEFQVARIGKGTVQSEVDRSIRVRLEGSGPASSRSIVADSKAAADLLTSPAGKRFEGAVRSFVAVADAHEGHEDLKTITFLPDEHASKGVSILNWATNQRQDGVDLDKLIEPSAGDVADAKAQVPGATTEQIRTALRRIVAGEATKELTKTEAADVSFAGAWNGNGNIVMMPDVSRDMLATIGLYRTQPGDELTKVPVKFRDEQARWSWHAAIHESEHSISPSRNVENPEWTRVMEEAIAEVLAPGNVSSTIKRAGGDPALAARPARDTKHEAVDWPAWNRDHLPKPPADQVATAKGRYTDGPELVKGLLRLAGIDRRTTDGKATALDLLQGENSSRVPRRLAEAIVAGRGLPAERTAKLADLIRDAAVSKASLGDIERFLGAG